MHKPRHTWFTVTFIIFTLMLPGLVLLPTGSALSPVSVADNTAAVCVGIACEAATTWNQPVTVTGANTLLLIVLSVTELAGCDISTTSVTYDDGVTARGPPTNLGLYVKDGTPLNTNIWEDVWYLSNPNGPGSLGLLGTVTATFADTCGGFGINQEVRGGSVLLNNVDTDSFADMFGLLGINSLSTTVGGGASTSSLTPISRRTTDLFVDFMSFFAYGPGVRGPTGASQTQLSTFPVEGNDGYLGASQKTPPGALSWTNGNGNTRGAQIALLVGGLPVGGGTGTTGGGGQTPVSPFEPTFPKLFNCSVVRFEDTRPQAANAIYYNWQFGDGESVKTTSSTVEHNYTKPGGYTAYVSVQDKSGAIQIFATDVKTGGTECILGQLADIILPIIATLVLVAAAVSVSLGKWLGPRLKKWLKWTFFIGSGTIVAVFVLFGKFPFIS